MNPQLRDTVKTTVSAVFTLTLNKAGENPTSRTLTIDYIVFDEESDIKEDIGSFRALLLGRFNKFLQPNGWRDDDLAESEWTTTAVEAKLINKTEAKFDYNE